MRVSLFVSALFVASLFGAAASADQPGDTGGRTARMPNMREVHVRQVREAREARPHETPQTKVRDHQLTDRLRARGDMIDRSSSRSSASTKAAHSDSIKAQRDADKALKQLTAKQDAVRNCSPTDDTCASSRAARVSSAAADKAAQQQRSDVQRMVDKIRAEKLREKIMKQLCERHANMCAENL
jgi:hypothetical protein